MCRMQNSHHIIGKGKLSFKLSTSYINSICHSLNVVIIAESTVVVLPYVIAVVTIGSSVHYTSC